MTFPPNFLNEYVAHVRNQIANLNGHNNMTTQMDDQMVASLTQMSRMQSMMCMIGGGVVPSLTPPVYGDLAPHVALALPDLSMLSPNDLNGTVDAMRKYICKLMEEMNSEDMEIHATSDGRQPGPALMDLRKLVFNNKVIGISKNIETLGKRLTKVKLIKNEEWRKRNPGMEAKLAQLCENAAMLNQAVTSKTKLAEFSNHMDQEECAAVQIAYETAANGLLAKINEVAYLLQNNN